MTQENLNETEFLSERENFYSKEGKPYLVRCPKCKMENYAFSVTSGICCWCGWNANIGGEWE